MIALAAWCVGVALFAAAVTAACCWPWRLGPEVSRGGYVDPVGEPPPVMGRKFGLDHTNSRVIIPMSEESYTQEELGEYLTQHGIPWRWRRAGNLSRNWRYSVELGSWSFRRVP